MVDGTLTRLRVQGSDKFCITQHLVLHASMLAANRAVYHWGSRGNRNSARGSRSYCAIDYREGRLVPIDIFDYLFYELAVLEWKTDMHHVTGRNRCRSEEHTSELQSLRHLVCRLLLEKKKKQKTK